MLKKYSMRSSVETGACPVSFAHGRETRPAAFLRTNECRKIKGPSHKKQRAREQLQFACPPRPDSKAILPSFFFSGAWIQEQRSVVSDLAEVKHVGDRVGERIE